MVAIKSNLLKKGPARKATLLKRLTLHKMAENSEVRDHLNDFFDTVDKLEDMNVELNKDQLAIMLLYNLPASFENFRCAIESRDDLPTPEALRAKIVEESDARRNGACSENSDAMFVHKNKERAEWRKETESRDVNTAKFKGIHCCKCKKPGHKKSE